MELTKIPSTTAVQGSEKFLYNFKVAFSGLTSGSIAKSAEIVDIFPSYVDFILPKIEPPFTDITTAKLDDGSTKVTFKFGDVALGTTFRFNIACFFTAGRYDGLVYANTATLYVEDEDDLSVTAEDVTLSLDENFRMYKSVLEGSVVDKGEEITIRLFLANNGDDGAEITNVVISDTLPTYLTPVDGDIPIGSEYIVDAYSDPQYNNRTGTWNGSTMEFDLPSYSGNGYAITFKVKVDDNVGAGTKILNTAMWSVDGEARGNANKTITVFEEKAESRLVKNAPDYGIVGGNIQYRILARNIGTVELSDYTIIDTLPDEVDLEKVSFRVDTNAISAYRIEIETSDNTGVYTDITGTLSDNSGVIELAEYIQDGERVVSIRVVADTAKMSSRDNTLVLYGKISDDAVEDSTISNVAKVTANSELSGEYSLSKTGKTILNGASILTITKKITPEQPAYFPLNEFLIVQTIDAVTSFLYAPIVADLLPEGVAYASRHHYFTYYDALSNTTYDSRNDNFPIIQPEPEVIEDYQGTGRTLVRFYFKNFVLEYRNRLTVNFTAVVDITAQKEFTNYSYVGSPSDITIVANNIDGYVDELDLDGDGFVNEIIAKSEGVGGVVLTTSLFSIEKWVKGDLAVEFDKSSLATAGGEVVYLLAVTNNQEDTLKDIEIVDILPHVGDTGVILNQTPRESQFPVYATTRVGVGVLNIVTGDVIETTQYKVEYSTGYDPIRFNEYGTGTIGTDEWSDTPPLDITTIGAVKVTTDSDFILNSYERLIISIFAKTPVGVDAGEVAYNSYAVNANRVNAKTGETSPMLPVEPPKVWVQIEENTLGSIGDFVWDDYNEDGVYDDGEVGLNGVTVKLLDENFMEIASTATSYNSDGKAGYYEFNNLEAGNYYVEFIPIAGFTITTQKEDEENGSKADKSTGITSLIVLAENEDKTNINAGLVGEGCGFPTIEADNKCVKLDTEFDPLDGVTASDCLGADLTDSIKIEKSDVDTSEVGTYTVTYSVTDFRGQTTTKTIYVGVYSSTARYQAVTDIVQSVALEETALSHILNAEAEKLSKITNMEGVTYDEVLKANKSVEQMVNSIASLEIMLMHKLELVNGNGESEDVCVFPD